MERLQISTLPPMFTGLWQTKSPLMIFPQPKKRENKQTPLGMMLELVTLRIANPSHCPQLGMIFIICRTAGSKVIVASRFDCLNLRDVKFAHKSLQAGHGGSWHCRKRQPLGVFFLLNTCLWLATTCQSFEEAYKIKVVLLLSHPLEEYKDYGHAITHNTDIELKNPSGC